MTTTASMPAAYAGTSATATPRQSRLAAAMAAGLPPWRLQPATARLLPQIAAMEAASYPADEACSLSNFQYRLAHAAPFFKVALSDDSPDGAAPADSPEVLGFVVGTLTRGDKLSRDTMFSHDAAGETLCIHSVVTAPGLRRRGLARAMLASYIASVASEQGGRLHAIHLLCKTALVPFYASMGFENHGPSDVAHGRDQWFDMVLPLAGAGDALLTHNHPWDSNPKDVALLSRGSAGGGGGMGKDGANILVSKPYASSMLTHEAGHASLAGERAINDAGNPVELTPAWSRRLMLANRLGSALFFIISVLLAVDAALGSSGRIPVKANYWLRQDEGGYSQRVVDVDNNVRLGFLSFTFTMLAAIDHFLVGWPMRGVYEAGLRQGRNPFRWIEYSISASTMNVLIALLCGILDVSALLMVGFLTATCMVFGLLGELVQEKWLQRLIFWLGCIPFVAVWAVIWTAFVQSVRLSDGEVPTFVYAIIVCLTICECAFGVNQIRPSKSFVYREVGFILLSPTAKLLLAGLTYGGLRTLPDAQAA